MSRVMILIPGKPQGKQRAKIFNGHGVTPEQTVMYENLVKTIYMQTGHPMFEGPVEVLINAYFPIPKSTSNKKRELMMQDKLLPTCKPDWDNIGKIICDSLNGVAWKDDAAITDARVNKRYGENPGVAVYIWGADDEDLSEQSGSI